MALRIRAMLAGSEILNEKRRLRRGPPFVFSGRWKCLFVIAGRQPGRRTKRLFVGEGEVKVALPGAHTLAQAAQPNGFAHGKVGG